MKESFKKVIEWMLKQRKKIIYSILALLIWQIFLFNFWGWCLRIQTYVYAEEVGTTDQESTKDFKEIATNRIQEVSIVKKIIYIILWPCLRLAGKLVDNSLVYWSIFWFDSVLWNLRNAVKNLANFGLWFIFVYKIWEILIKKKQGDSKIIKELLTSVLIAWVWIQASWFVMAALIDVSTILTYGIGWLPLSLLSKENLLGKENDDNENKYNPYVLKTVISIDAESLDSVDFYLTDPAKAGASYISECTTYEYDSGEYKETLLLAPSKVYYHQCDSDCSNSTYVKTEMNSCVYWWQVYYFSSPCNEFLLQLGEGGNGDIGDLSSTDKARDSQNEYNNMLNTAMVILKNKEEDDIIRYIQAWNLLQVWNIHEKWGVLSKLNVNVSPDVTYWLDVNNKRSATEWQTLKLWDLIDKSEWYVWVFATLYSSLLNWMSKVWESSNDGVYLTVLNVLLSCGHMIAIWIPLIAMVVVFFMRILILRLAIALSPIIILLKAFNWDTKVFKSKTFEHFQVQNLIGIILSPVVMCFAVSLSTVLVCIIQTVNKSQLESELTPILWWLIEIRLSWIGLWLWEAVIAVMWVVITRFLVWAAIQMSTLWKSKIIQNMKEIATASLWSVPIIPVVWTNWVSFVGATGAGQALDKAKTKITTKVESRDTEAVKQLFTSNSEKQWQVYVNKFVETMSNYNWSNWVSDLNIKVGASSITFNNLSDENKKTIIDKFNWISENIRKKLWSQCKEINIWNTKYVFDDTSIENNQPPTFKYKLK